MIAECEGLLLPKHDAGTVNRHEHFGNAAVVQQPPLRCSSYKAGISIILKFFRFLFSKKEQTTPVIP